MTLDTRSFLDFGSKARDFAFGILYIIVFTLWMFRGKYSAGMTLVPSAVNWHSCFLCSENTFNFFRENEREVATETDLSD